MYQVTSFDLCAQGFERLRNQDEFILVGYPRNKNPRALIKGFLSDIQSCAREDDFDYQACENAVKQYFRDNREYIKAQLSQIDWRAHNRDWHSEGITAFLYIERKEA